MLGLRSRTGVLPVAGFPLSPSGSDCHKQVAARAPLYSGLKVRLGFGRRGQEEEDGTQRSVNTDSTTQSGLCS